MRPADVTIRGKARSYLYADGGGPMLIVLSSSDAVVGGFYEVSRAGGQLMAWLRDQGAPVELFDRADAFECAGWAGAMRRIRTLAGESQQ